MEKLARHKQVRGEALRLLREQGARPVLAQIHKYLLKIREQVLPKSEAGQAIAYALKNWTALTRYCDDGDVDRQQLYRTVVARLCGWTQQLDVFRQRDRKSVV